jgi:hypothetical protein
MVVWYGTIEEYTKYEAATTRDAETTAPREVGDRMMVGSKGCMAQVQHNATTQQQRSNERATQRGSDRERER